MFSYQEIQQLLAKTDINQTYRTICKNIKKYRLEKYNFFRENNFNSSLNPYSSENIAALLNYNHNHYKRFESNSDSTKRIPLEKLIKLCIIFDRNIDDFFKQ